jgi:hypothetical protein
MEAPKNDPLEALAFLDKILGDVAGSRRDHVAIQGAIGVIGAALRPKPELTDSEKRVGHELQGSKAE